MFEAELPSVRSGNHIFNLDGAVAVRNMARGSALTGLTFGRSKFGALWASSLLWAAGTFCTRSAFRTDFFGVPSSWPPARRCPNCGACRTSARSSLRFEIVGQSAISITAGLVMEKQKHKRHRDTSRDTSRDTGGATARRREQKPGYEPGHRTLTGQKPGHEPGHRRGHGKERCARDCGAFGAGLRRARS